MRYETVLAYLELFLSLAIFEFEFELIWFAVVFESLSDCCASIKRDWNIISEAVGAKSKYKDSEIGGEF